MNYSFPHDLCHKGLRIICLYPFRRTKRTYEDATFSLSGDVGAISADGLYVASGTPGAEGTITVSAAGLTATVPVKVAVEFADMKGHWAAGPVKELYEAGIVTGITETTFGPDNTMRRCDFVLMLYRAAGQPQVSAASGFTDVPADAYYASAVAWAKAEGITTGTSDTTFSITGSAIGLAVRLSLRTRLTLIRLALIRKP